MFRSFFPRPILFFGSFVVWALLCLFAWHLFGKPQMLTLTPPDSSLLEKMWVMQTVVRDALGTSLGEFFSLGGLFGLPPPNMDALEALQREFAKTNDGALAEKIQALEYAMTFWTYQFVLTSYALFVGAGLVVSKHKWRGWSIAGSGAIVFFTWYIVQLDVMINDWFGTFYDMIQGMFAKPGSISIDTYYGQLVTFFIIAGVFVIVRTLGGFFIQHYNFRWRTAMNEYYNANWGKIRNIEGASQRVQDDTMRFADIMEGLGTGLLDAIMTLIAFLPILWVLSEKFISTIPIFGPIAHGLVVASICWSVLGTLILAFTGYYLPMLEFHNQRVEHAYRKELVFGEENTSRAEPMTVRELFAEVRKNYFRMFFHYVYFNLVRYSYLQASVLVPYFALAPTLTSAPAIAAGFTLGAMQQIIRAFGRVQDSFQYFAQNYQTIIKMLSIFKRLRPMDRAIAMTS